MSIIYKYLNVCIADAKENGVEIFYVTNRSEKGYKSTEEGIPKKTNCCD